MKLVKLLFITSMVAPLMACTSTQPSLNETLTKNQQKQLTKVYQMTSKGNKVTFIVKSHGCTLPEHFELKRAVNQQGQLELALLRSKEDFCRAMPRAYPVSFELDGSRWNEQNTVLINAKGDVSELPKKAQRPIDIKR